MNLDANDAYEGPFNWSDPDNSSNFRTVATVYDSLGNPHSATTFFEKAPLPATNLWNYHVGIPSGDTDTPPLVGTDNFVGNGSDSHSIRFPFNAGADPTQEIDFNFGPFGDAITPFGGAGNTINSFSQDGFTSGTLQSVSVGADGTLSGQFSNGATVDVAQLALVPFPNTDGLVSVGNNRVVESSDSAHNAVIGEASRVRFLTVSGARWQSHLLYPWYRLARGGVVCATSRESRGTPERRCLLGHSLLQAYHWTAIFH